MIIDNSIEKKLIILFNNRIMRTEIEIRDFRDCIENLFDDKYMSEKYIPELVKVLYDKTDCISVMTNVVMAIEYLINTKESFYLFLEAIYIYIEDNIGYTSNILTKTLYSAEKYHFWLKEYINSSESESKQFKEYINRVGSDESLSTIYDYLYDFIPNKKIL